MTSRAKQITACCLSFASLWMAMSCSPAAMSAGSSQPAQPSSQEVTERLTDAASSELDTVPEQETAEQDAEPQPARVVRRIKGSEMTLAVVKKARAIINEHYKKPFGYEVEFEIDGKHYVGRIEPHYHPPGGALHPWGHHAGCSLYVVEQG
ncbi:MAG: hypothetical protein R3B13_06170 [Polyangiaceae bacterium]